MPETTIPDAATPETTKLLADAERSPELNIDEPSDLSSQREENSAALPIIGLEEMVVFPHTAVPVLIDNPQRAAALQETITQHREVLLVPTPNSETLAQQVGAVVTRARVLQLQPHKKGLVVLVEGLERVRLLAVNESAAIESGTWRAEPDQQPSQSDEYWQAAVKNLRETAIEVVRRSPNVPDEIEALLAGLEGASQLTDFLAGNLAMDAEDKLDLLAQTSVVKRVDKVQKSLNNQLRISNIQAKLRENVESELTDSQRRAYLREQMRAIQKELGEDDGSDEKIAELRERLVTAALPEAVAPQIERELDRLERIPPTSPDYAGSVDYLEVVASLPWSKLSDTPIDLERAREILDRDHFGLERVKRRLLEFLAVRKLNPDGRAPILCLVGPPGVGKTSLGQSIANALGREFVRIALGGVQDEAEIRGHRRTYVGAMLGRLLQALRRAETRDAVVMLDEIDKLGSDFRGDPASALLEVLDPSQNHAFVDRYLDLPFDLSRIVFITTANQLDPIPAPLLDRMEIIRIAGYTRTEKRAIAARYLVPRQIKDNGLNDDQIRWTDAAIDTVIDQYTREAGVRLLEQKLGAVTRYIAAKVASNEIESAEVNPSTVAEALGPRTYTSSQRATGNAPGVVNGLAFTPVGGEVLQIEAIRYPGKGHLQLTGQLGSVMQESVRAAESLVKSRVEQLGIRDALDKFDTHLHVPAGAIPKDGPSAGAAMFTALASLHSNRAVNSDVAMTGEINLRGQVLPIGGLPEKTLAALAAGVKKVLIPRGNEAEIGELPDEVRQGLEIVAVDSVDDVLREVLLK